ncbi:hypothetical protein FNV43_RR06522 [Rhamnella rubrinervis]|uniref:Uncharacterized protein n=1 Tax=Rhamnella rubrinervis TaxID=2594499 RepID=A0A8K0MM22_9ROSA|nr:hypothetical protein FNV43_RR06522 [Rhamnella rubrinervis]
MHEHEDVNAIDGSLRQVASSGTNKYGFMEFQPPERVEHVTRVLKTISTQMENMEEECNVVVEENGKTEELIDYETINAVNMDDMIYV